MLGGLSNLRMPDRYADPELDNAPFDDVILQNTGSAAIADHQVDISALMDSGTECNAVYSENLARYEHYNHIGDDTGDVWDGETWVKVDALSVGQSKMIRKFRELAADRSTTAIWDLYEHFLGSTIDSALWNTTGTPTVSGGIVTLNASETVYSKTTFGVNYAIRAYAYVKATKFSGIGFTTGGGGAPLTDVEYQHNGVTWGLYLRNHNGASQSFSADLGMTGAYHVFDISRNSSTNTRVSIDNGTPIPLATYVPSGSLSACLWGYADSSSPEIRADWVFIRKCTDVEPSLITGAAA